ncbi:MAG: transcriptional repressor [Armatimonadota bacterium]|nr:transcriptional repressor [Armatimonadota bacterium]MDR7533797.1 transcriptional repressor [Armatimonadota bacterium]MDR7536674.1 transcriptional repressor [Armatimonadota bacterium]
MRLSPPHRQTRQRASILRILERAGCHLTAEEIHRRLRRRGHRVGLATVYRAVELFVRSGLVEPAYLADGGVRYGLAAKHHDHAVCLRCGRFQALRPCVVPRAPRRLPAGFRITGHQLEIYGVCAACQAAGG